MATCARKRTRFVVLPAIVILSAACMLWLFWRFPLVTSIATLIVLVGFGVSARVASLIETERSDLKRRNQRV